MNHLEVFDITIIGGGPAGLFSAFYSGLREMKTKIIEYQNELGGKVRFYPEKLIWDVGALTPITGEKLLKQMVEQALTFDPTVVLGEKVISIDQNERGYFAITTNTGQIHLSKSVIVAIGGGVISPKKLEVEDAEKYEASNLNYSLKKLKKFKDKIVLISGGGHSAVDWANELHSIAKKVYLVYRKDKGQMQAHEADLTRLFNSTAECLFYSEITKLIPSKTECKIEQVELTNLQTGKKMTIPVDEVVINHGYESDRSLMENSSLHFEMLNDFYIKGNSYCETNIPGLYAVGDAVMYEGKVHLILGAFQDAVNKAKKFIQPDANDYAMVSSHNELFYSRNQELIKKEIQEPFVTK